MKRINIAFGIHNHQPVGNFDFVFEEAYQKSYLPFLELLERHPQIRLTQHYTGILLEWIKRHKPEFFPRLKKLVNSGQVEMMTGGFYEPILSVIPDCDKAGQIRKLSRFVEEEFNYQPKGMWLAERIWEPHLAASISEAGVQYVVLDDSHFKSAGLKEQELYGYYLTEEQGRTAYLFPIAEQLRYTIPFQPPENTIEFLDSIATEDGQALVVFADDGEKFGVWPGTYEHCYEERWLERFFQALEENREWITVTHLSEALKNIKPLGRIYLPTASYREMMEWAMPTGTIHEYEKFEGILKEQGLLDRYKVFVRGGFWRNFLVKYPESNNMHKKMMLLSDRLQRLKQSFGYDTAFNEARDHVWAGQCNCPYWHGVFGGIYLNHLRYATYHELIQAEVLLDGLENEGNWMSVQQTDFDRDGADEVLLSNRLMNVYLSPQNGGCIFELDFKPKAINLLDTMTRREESYHKKLTEMDEQEAEPEHSHDDGDTVASIHDVVVTKEEGLENLLFYDWYRRTSLLDHFMPNETRVEHLYQSKYKELGDFVNQPYENHIEKGEREQIVVLKREGFVHIGEQLATMLVQKTIHFPNDAAVLRIDYFLQNRGEVEMNLKFGVEFDFALLAGDAHDRNYVFPGHDLDNSRLNSIGEVKNSHEACLKDEWLKILISLKTALSADFWRFPIETVSQSEGGFERVYQNSVVLPNWDLKFAPGQEWTNTLNLDVSGI